MPFVCHYEWKKPKMSKSISSSPLFSNNILLKKNMLKKFPNTVLFPQKNYWDVLIFHPISPQIKGGFMLSQYVVLLGQKYWETAKTTSSIILKLLLRHLPIPIIGKLLEML